jgi:hypothetical protein
MPKQKMPEDVEKALRALLRKHVRKLGKALLTPGCRGLVESFVLQGIAVLGFLERESKRKNPTKAYERFFEDMKSGIAEGDLSPFARMKLKDVSALGKLLDSLMAGIGGRKPPQIDAKAFVDMQGRAFVTPQKRGPKNKELGDAAFLLALKNESTKSIAQRLDPDGFALNADKSMQNIRRAVALRRRQAGLA